MPVSCRFALGLLLLHSLFFFSKQKPADEFSACLVASEMFIRAGPNTFWGKQEKFLNWTTPYQKVKTPSFAPAIVSIKWYGDGPLNLAATCLARLLQENGDRTA
ncbi:acetyl-coenzyme A synthetase N-terminal domain-containing protein, partial [Salmonella enterica]|uniref:acetyl-coenzyme A synthetase N-terminal domain-containing protein n=1 Tax=Salmonella enterica TaxID=28901 RepID=UPI00292A4180